MSFIDFEEVKKKLSLEDAISFLDLSLKQSGNQWRGKCHACESTNDRALVITRGKGFYCFSARKGGDVIALVAHIRGVAVKEAAEQIAEHVGMVQAPRNGTVPETVPGSVGGKDKGDRTLQPLAYLEPDHESVRALGLSKETCEHFGAGYAPKGIMRGRLAIPIHDLAGDLVAYCGRAVKDGQKPALLFPKGFRPELYLFNVHRIKAGELYCVEDPLDVLVAYENGVENVIAFLHHRDETMVPLRRPA